MLGLFSFDFAEKSKGAPQPPETPARLRVGKVQICLR